MRFGELPSMHVPARPSGVATPNPHEREAPACPNCGDECEPESLPTFGELRWPCCGYRQAVDPYDDPSL